MLQTYTPEKGSFLIENGVLEFTCSCVLVEMTDTIADALTAMLFENTRTHEHKNAVRLSP
jgi:hypothetical protein